MISLFGVSLTPRTLDALIQELQETRTRPFWIVTANPEILLEARRNAAYRAALMQADLRILDGIGLVFAAVLHGHRAPRVTGVELGEALVQYAWTKQQLVCLIGGEGDAAATSAQELARAYPNVRCMSSTGGRVNASGEGDDVNEEALHQIILAAPDVILVAFGHPKQEAWIAAHLHELPPHCVVVGVGGTFDYWSHRISRAPRWMRALGLEWLYRLTREPKRWKRIWRAVVVFPCCVAISFIIPTRAKI